MAGPTLEGAPIVRSRKRILAAAAALLARGGVAAVTVRAITARVGMSPVALYRFFPGG